MSRSFLSPLGHSPFSRAMPPPPTLHTSVHTHSHVLVLRRRNHTRTVLVHALLLLLLVLYLLQGIAFCFVFVLLSCRSPTAWSLLRCSELPWQWATRLSENKKNNKPAPDNTACEIGALYKYWYDAHRISTLFPRRRRRRRRRSPPCRPSIAPPSCPCPQSLRSPRGCCGSSRAK